MAGSITRRDMVLRTVPAIALTGLLSSPLFADDAVTPTPPPPDSDAPYNGVEYVLPPLPYAYDALEPHIDAQTMHLHHDKHHNGYVSGLNKTLKELGELDAAGAPPPPTLLTALQEDLSFNASGHFLHSLFWKIMGPNAGGEPTGAVGDAIKQEFGSPEQFRARFATMAGGVKGSGWAILAYEPFADRLITLQVKQHDLQLVPWAQPILVLDVWEHAYYLKYQNVRSDYVKAWWDVVNWPAVDQALSDARKRYGH